MDKKTEKKHVNLLGKPLEKKIFYDYTIVTIHGSYKFTMDSLLFRIDIEQAKGQFISLYPYTIPVSNIIHITKENRQKAYFDDITDAEFKPEFVSNKGESLL